MLNKLKKDNKGFTIIEVMIVLAIAGLIILIVLLAIPALQRNGRNTSTKNDASSLAAGISEFKSNNDGKAPASGEITGTGTITIGAASSSQVTVKVNGNSTFANIAVPTAASPLAYQAGSKCNAAGTAVAAGTARDIAVLYFIENTGTGATKCIES